MDPRQPVAEAVGVRGDKIVFVGSEADVRDATAKRRIDLAGRALLPAFIDAHQHMLHYGLNLQRIDCQDPALKSVEDALRKIEAVARTLPPDEWVLGWGFDDARMREKRMPTKEELDSAGGGRPVVIQRTCTHVSIASGRALQLAGITAATPDPQGGRIVRDAAGEPTGVLQEAAQRLVWDKLPPPTREKMREALKAADRRYVEEGIATVVEAAVGYSTSLPEELPVWLDLWRDGEMMVRSRLMLYGDRSQLDPEVARPGYGDMRMRLVTAKFFADGGFGGRTAALFEPYEGSDDDYGVLNWDLDYLITEFEKAHREGWQIAIHGIGDKAVDQILTAYEVVSRRVDGWKERRHRLEHFGLVTWEDIRRARDLHIVLVPQYYFLWFLGDSFYENLGHERANRVYPGRSLLDAGIPVANSSDRPVMPGNPWFGIKSAIDRTTRDGKRLGVHEGISLTESLRLYTLGGAYSFGDERLLGSIEVGKLADLIMVDPDPYTVPVEELDSVAVHMTMIGGEVKFSR